MQPPLQPDAPVGRIRLGRAPGIDAQKRALIEKLVMTSAGATDHDVAQVVRELASVPTPVLQKLAAFDYTYVVCHDSITEHLTHLAGQRPRGWPPGSTWDQCAGLHVPGGYQIVVAANRKRDRTVLHETGHALDYVTGLKLRASDAFESARSSDILKLEAYFAADSAAGREETFAESFANHLLGDARWPHMDAFWRRVLHDAGWAA